MYWLYNSCQYIYKNISPGNCVFKLELFYRTVRHLFLPEDCWVVPTGYRKCNCLEFETISKLLDYNDYWWFKYPKYDIINPLLSFIVQILINSRKRLRVYKDYALILKKKRKEKKNRDRKYYFLGHRRSETYPSKSDLHLNLYFWTKAVEFGS